LGCVPYDSSKTCQVGEKVFIDPDDLREEAPVFCKVGGNVYTHKIRSIRGPAGDREFQISRQDERRINGWTRIIYGQCVRTEN
jgi:hypothetical protein